MTDIASRAAAAKRLLDDEVLAEALDDLRDELIRDWRNTADDKTETRENVWRTLKALDRITAKLESYVNDGKFAELRQ